MCGVLFLTALPPCLTAQDDPRLIEAVRLAQDGQGDSARANLSRMLASTSLSDTLYPQILYTLGTIASTAGERERNDRRIAVEFASSSWADDAVLRLAQMDYAANNPAGTARQVDRIRSDYPSSPLLPVAAFWGARAYFDLKNSDAACRWLAFGLERVGDDIELANQLKFYHGRCARNPARTDSAAMDTMAREAAPPPPSPPPPARDTLAPGQRGFAVQVAAVQSAATADQLVKRLKAAGHEARVLKGDDGLLRVRVGRFPDRASALAAAQKMKSRLGGSPYVVAEP